MPITIAVIDGMGAGIGTQIITRIRKELPGDITVLALGTNAVATDKMVQAGATRGATGANAIRVSVARADYVIGPIGIVLPDSLMGEVTADTAAVIMASRARKLLLPVYQQHIRIMGLEEKSIKDLISLAIEIVRHENNY
jgi:hypothetical protein